MFGDAVSSDISPTSDTLVTVYSSQPCIMLYGVILSWKTHIFPMMFFSTGGTGGALSSYRKNIMFVSWVILWFHSYVGFKGQQYISSCSAKIFFIGTPTICSAFLLNNVSVVDPVGSSTRTTILNLFHTNCFLQRYTLLENVSIPIISCFGVCGGVVM